MIFGKKTFLVGLDIGSRTLKLAQAENKKKGWNLNKFGMLEITPGLIEEGNIRNPEAVADSIRQLFRIHKVKETNVAISVGGYSTIVDRKSVV